MTDDTREKVHDDTRKRTREQYIAMRIERHPDVRNVEWVSGNETVRYFIIFRGEYIPDRFGELYDISFVSAWITKEREGWVDAMKHVFHGDRMKALFELEVDES